MSSINSSQVLTPESALPKTRHGLHRTQQIWGIIFLSPWIIGFLIFTLFPIAASLILSFTNYNLNEADEIAWIGLANYQQLFTDPIVGVSLRATLKFALIALPLAILLPVGLAALLNAKQLKGKRIFRTLFYMPYMVPVISSVAIWQGMLNSETGWINRFLGLIGITGPEWLNDVNWIYPALNIIGLWGVGNSMLITLAAMQGVPTELYEAATVDGAGPFARFRNITLPMISPVILYNLVLSIIGLFRYFEIPYIFSQGTGRPGDSTMFFNLHLYKTAFVYKEMGYGSALAWLLFVMAMGATLVVFLSARRWVYYASGEDF